MANNIVTNTDIKTITGDRFDPSGTTCPVPLWVSGGGDCLTNQKLCALNGSGGHNAYGIKTPNNYAIYDSYGRDANRLVRYDGVVYVYTPYYISITTLVCSELTIKSDSGVIGKVVSGVSGITKRGDIFLFDDNKSRTCMAYSTNGNFNLGDSYISSINSCSVGSAIVCKDNSNLKTATLTGAYINFDACHNLTTLTITGDSNLLSEDSLFCGSLKTIKLYSPSPNFLGQTTTYYDNLPDYGTLYINHGTEERYYLGNYCYWQNNNQGGTWVYTDSSMIGKGVMVLFEEKHWAIKDVLWTGGGGGGGYYY